MDRSRWQREMCQERTCTAKPAVDLHMSSYEQKAKLAKLCRSKYGTRGAASVWEDKWSEVLKDGSMKVGTACPAFFCGQDGFSKSLCHGDDF